MHTAISGTTIAAIIVVLLIIAAAVWAFVSTRTQQLRSRFGPEYEREVAEHGNRWRAEGALTARERRIAQLRIRPLSRSEAERFAAAWGRIQTRFVDDPAGAVTEADALLTEVMQTRGYPARDTEFGQRAADLSVHHATFVDDYRAADEIARRHSAGDATTEDLRRAMVHYRALFDDLLEVREPRDERATA